MPAVPLIPTLLVALFGLLALTEVWRPMRAARRGRWPLNIALGLANVLLVRLLAVAAPAAAALWAEAQGIGLFNAFPIPLWLEMILAVTALDFAIYWQHRAFHALPWGWALHRLHHADRDFDVTTGIRFHPGEALVSMLYKGVLVLALGVSLPAVLAFEAWLAAGSLIEHSNTRLPARVDAIVRRIWITPAVHSIHHSAHGQDHNHNFGFAIGLWDRWFGTWQDAPSGPNIGLPQSGGRD
jgi:sterol desaturase/sphingolipid hydroxylase (fatty acid hydroxylase superfamily)